MNYLDKDFENINNKDPAWFESRQNTARTLVQEGLENTNDSTKFIRTLNSSRNPGVYSKEEHDLCRNANEMGEIVQDFNQNQYKLINQYQNQYQDNDCINNKDIKAKDKEKNKNYNLNKNKNQFEEIKVHGISRNSSQSHSLFKRGFSAISPRLEEGERSTEFNSKIHSFLSNNMDKSVSIDENENENEN